MASASPSDVNFPVSESPQRHTKPVAQLKGPHLPFRRISLPSAPSLLHRVSVASVVSFDSMQEVHDPQSPQSPHGHHDARPKSRPMSVESPRRRRRVRRDSSVKPPDGRQAAKRRRVIEEFYETEKAYVDGLELIYSHFLTPIIASLDAPEPLLNRSVLTSIFSNFIDIWNLHRSFFSALTEVLKPISGSPPPLSPLLLSHFPYLSLYTPFVTAFPSTISALTELISPPTTTRPNANYNSHFATFLSTQEADPRCGRLKLRDWLLAIVQRCPRYMLLLKNLINCTEKDDPEHAQLMAVHALVSKITLSLNTSLHTHAQTLALLALQRATPNLPFQLITPGRTLLKRGPLVQIENSSAPAEREFLLFSDCLIWLASAEPSSNSWDWSWSGSGASNSTQNTPTGSKITPPPLTRNRSKSEAQLPTMKGMNGSGSIIGEDEDVFLDSPQTPVTPQGLSKRRRSHYHAGPPPPPNMAKRHASSDDKWIYKGRVDLVDLDIVISSPLEDERRFELLSPEGSFALYSVSEDEREEWTSEIRAAKAQLLISLNVTNPNTTLTSSASTNHVRRALQALPYPPSDDRLATLRSSNTSDAIFSSISPNGKGKSSKKDKSKRGRSAERRRKVDHWVPAVWIPDGKTNSCMRCGRTFGWRRRRHHCRLCGRCVCASCSGRTFFISDPTREEDTGKAARACDACYETVFPLVDPLHSVDQVTPSTANKDASAADTISSLSHLPSWLSMPSLPVQRQPRALMAIDLKPGPDSSFESGNLSLTTAGGADSNERERKTRMRVKSHQRLRSYQEILEDFQREGKAMQIHPRPVSGGDEAEDSFNVEQEEGDDDEGEDGVDSWEEQDLWSTPTHSLASSPASSPRKPRKEDTARMSKRFSLPALALHTTNVTARTTEAGGDATASLGEVLSSSPARSVLAKRFSLVMGGRNSHHGEGVKGQDDLKEEEEEPPLGQGEAAARLTELLGREMKA